MIDMEMKNSYQAFGAVFADMRRAQNITQGALAKNLMTGRAISKLEQFGTLPDPLVFDVLIRRLGASTQFFMTMLTEREYEYLSWKEDILKKIEEGSIQASDWDSEMAKARQIHEGLQAQFAEFWKGYTLCDTEMMERAIARTVTGYPGPLSADQCVSTEEIMYMLLDLEKSMRSRPAQEVKAMLLSILRYMETRCVEEEQVKMYAKAVCLFGECAADKAEKFRFYKRALELYRRQAVVTGMCDILSGLLREGEQMKAAEREEYERELWALMWVKQEFQIEEPSLMRGELNQQFCLLHEVLGAYRQERGLMIRDIDERVCSEKTYRALETGKRGAKKGTYQSLAEYMEIPIGVYNAEIISDSYQDLALAAEIKNLLHRQQDEIAMYKLSELEERLGDKVKIGQNAQFISSIRDIMQFEAGEITLDEYQNRVEHAIRLTIPEWNINYGTHFYTEREMILVYYEAGIFRKKKDYDTAIRLLRMLWEQLEQSRVSLIHRSNEALLINTLWKDLLTDVKDYDGALEKVRIGMQLSFAAGNGAFLDALALEPGWIMSVREQKLSDGQKLKCSNYFRSALYISKLYGRKRTQRCISRYCGENGIEL